MRYAHNAERGLRVPPQSVALLAVLMLRGPQTAGELRINCDRLHRFADISAVEGFLQELAARPAGALVVELPRTPGSRETRWAHLLAGAPAVDATAPSPAFDAARSDASPSDLAMLRDTVSALQAEVASLRAALDSLRADLAAARDQRDGAITPANTPSPNPALKRRPRHECGVDGAAARDRVGKRRARERGREERVRRRVKGRDVDPIPRPIDERELRARRDVDVRRVRVVTVRPPDARGGPARLDDRRRRRRDEPQRCELLVAQRRERARVERRRVLRVVRDVHAPFEARDIGQVRHLVDHRSKRRREVRERGAVLVEVARERRRTLPVLVREAVEELVADESQAHGIRARQCLARVRVHVAAIKREARAR